MDIKRLRELIELEKNDEYGNYFVIEEISSILCKDLNETISFLDGSTQVEFYWVSSSFDNVAEKYRSYEFIDCLRRNQARFPEISKEVEVDIDYAIMMTEKKEEWKGLHLLHDDVIFFIKNNILGALNLTPPLTAEELLKVAQYAKDKYMLPNSLKGKGKKPSPDKEKIFEISKKTYEQIALAVLPPNMEYINYYLKKGN